MGDMSIGDTYGLFRKYPVISCNGEAESFDQSAFCKNVLSYNNGNTIIGKKEDAWTDISIKIVF